MFFFFSKKYKTFYIGYTVNAAQELIGLNGELQSWAPWDSDYGQPSGGNCVSTFNVDGLFWSEYCKNAYLAICQWPGYLRTY